MLEPIRLSRVQHRHDASASLSLWKIVTVANIYTAATRFRFCGLYSGNVFSLVGLWGSYNCGLVQPLRYSISRANCNSAIYARCIFVVCLRGEFTDASVLSGNCISSHLLKVEAIRLTQSRASARRLSTVTRGALLHTYDARVGSVICKLC